MVTPTLVNQGIKYLLHKEIPRQNLYIYPFTQSKLRHGMFCSCVDTEKFNEYFQSSVYRMHIKKKIVGQICNHC